MTLKWLLNPHFLLEMSRTGCTTQYLCFQILIWYLMIVIPVCFNLSFVFSDLSSFLCLFLSLWLASVPMFSLCLSCLMSSHPCAYVPSVPESVMSQCEAPVSESVSLRRYHASCFTLIICVLCQCFLHCFFCLDRFDLPVGTLGSVFLSVSCHVILSLCCVSSLCVPSNCSSQFLFFF